MRQFAGNREPVFDADPEPGHPLLVRQAGPPPQETMTRGDTVSVAPEAEREPAAVSRDG